MSVQLCEGIWRNLAGQRLVITQCEPVDGQRWTDGAHRYSDDGLFWGRVRLSANDLVAFVELLPDRPQPDQTAEIDRLRTELQQTQAWRTAATDAHSQSEALRIDMQAKIDRMQAEWQTEFTAAQQLRSEVAQLERLLDESREKLRYQEAAAIAFDHHCEGMKAAFLATIKTLTGVQS